MVWLESSRSVDHGHSTYVTDRCNTHTTLRPAPTFPQ